MQPKGESSPDSHVEEDEEGDHLNEDEDEDEEEDVEEDEESDHLRYDPSSKLLLLHLASRLFCVLLINGLVKEKLDEENVKGAVENGENPVEKVQTVRCTRFR